MARKHTNTNTQTDIAGKEEAQHKATQNRAKETAAYRAARAETRQVLATMEKALSMHVLSSNLLLEVCAVIRRAKHVHLGAAQTESLQFLEQELLGVA